MDRVGPAVAVAAVDLVAVVLQPGCAVVIPVPGIPVARPGHVLRHGFQMFAPARRQHFVGVQGDTPVDIGRHEGQGGVAGIIETPRVNRDLAHLAARFQRHSDGAIRRTGVSDDTHVSTSARGGPAGDEPLLVQRDAVAGDLHVTRFLTPQMALTMLTAVAFVRSKSSSVTGYLLRIGAALDGHARSINGPSWRCVATDGPPIVGTVLLARSAVADLESVTLCAGLDS